MKKLLFGLGAVAAVVTPVVAVVSCGSNSEGKTSSAKTDDKVVAAGNEVIAKQDALTKAALANADLKALHDKAIAADKALAALAPDADATAAQAASDAAWDAYNDALDKSTDANVVAAREALAKADAVLKAAKNFIDVANDVVAKQEALLKAALANTELKALHEAAIAADKAGNDAATDAAWDKYNDALDKSTDANVVAARTALHTAEEALRAQAK